MALDHNITFWLHVDLVCKDLIDLTWGIHKTKQISAIMTKMAFKGRWDIFYDTHLNSEYLASKESVVKAKWYRVAIA